MNIFFLYLCAIEAARAQCDKHVPKMATEVAQMLCCVWRKLHGQMTKGQLNKIKPKKRRKVSDEPQLTEQEFDELCKKSEKADSDATKLKLYKMSHYNHPMTLWVGLSMDNFNWALDHGFALCEEYKLRWHSNDDVEHACLKVFRFMSENKHKLEDLFSEEGFTQPPQCMPEKYRVEGDPVAAYRAYYIGEKAAFAEWKYSDKPEFWVH